MRLRIVRNGHGLRAKLMMRMIRLLSRDPSHPQDIVRTMLYRPAFFGKPASDVIQMALRGPSEWTVGERELFAAFTSSLNKCQF